MMRCCSYNDGCDVVGKMLLLGLVLELVLALLAVDSTVHRFDGIN